MKNLNFTFLALLVLIVLTALYRILPFHPVNFAPITAIALLGSAYFRRKWMAYFIPLSIMFISDLFIGLHNEMPAVYVSYALIITLGFVLRDRVKPLRVFGVAIASSVLFYLLTNFYCWYNSPFYTQDLRGLIINYTGALPFFRNTLLGDMIFTCVFFAAFEYARFKFPKLRKA